MVTSAQLYLSVVTLTALFSLPSPHFGYAIVTTPDATWGNVFSFVASANHAILINTAILGVYALYRDVPASRFLNLHVVLVGATYVTAMLMNFMLWDSHKLAWSTAIPGAVSSMDNLGNGTIAYAEQLVVGFDPPAELVTVVATPLIAFNLVLLPLALFASPSIIPSCGIIGCAIEA